MKKDLLCLSGLPASSISDIFSLTERFKQEKRKIFPLRGKTLGLIFEKPSNRTRVSFEVAMHQLGGLAIYLGEDQLQLGKRESIADAARTVSRYLDGVVLRTFFHRTILEFAGFSSVPVINGLSDLCHPCQALADIFTLKEKKGRLKGLKAVFVGDGNNVARSWAWGAARTGIKLVLSSPRGYQLEESLIKDADREAAKQGAYVRLQPDPREAVKDADLVYTDVWVSMGQEKEASQRKKDFGPYQVNEALVSLAKKDCLVMHCLPARRGEEITDSVIDGKHSVVWDEAENRLHVQKAILYTLLRGKEKLRSSEQKEDL